MCPIQNLKAVAMGVVASIELFGSNMANPAMHCTVQCADVYWALVPVAEAEEPHRACNAQQPFSYGNFARSVSTKNGGRIE
jgi:hypothetical protein